MAMTEAEEMQAWDVSVIFDGTTHLGEATAVVLWFLNYGWDTQQQLVRLMLLAKSLTGVEVARDLIIIFCTNLRIGPDNLLAAMRDSAAVNGAARELCKFSTQTLWM